MRLSLMDDWMKISWNMRFFTEFEMRVSFIGVFVLSLFYCVNNYAPVFIYISMCECMVETCI